MTYGTKSVGAETVIHVAFPANEGAKSYDIFQQTLLKRSIT